MNIGDLTRTVRTKVELCPDEGCGCWLWTGSVDSSGYASVKMRGTVVIVHRYTYEKLIGGPITLEGDPDPTLDHLNCCSRRCVNPHHVQVVSRSENSRRANETKYRGVKFDVDGNPITRKGNTP